jgi:hypothetical protein
MFNCGSRIHQSTLISDIFYINQVLKEYEKEIKKKKNMGVAKVEIDIIANVTVSSIARAMHSVKNGNVIMCLTSQ